MTLIIIIFYYIIIPLIIGLIARFIYLICNRGAVMKNNIQCAKTMIVLGSGGHTTEMFKILNNLDVNKYKPRIYVLGHTDKMSESKINEFESCNNDYRVIKIYRSRQVGQSYLSNLITIMYELAPLTGENIPWDILINYCNKISKEIKVRLIVLINDIKSSLELNKIPEQIDYKLIELDACLDRTWEDLNTGHWKDVPINYRHCYTICSLLKCILLEVNLKDKSTLEDQVIKEIAKQIDKGLLLGAPIDQQPELLTNIASKINNYCSNKISSLTSEKSLEFEIDDKSLSYELLEGCEWLKRYKTPSMETFYREIFKSKVPAVLEDCIGHWKALTLWKDQNYLIKIGGMRTVPIEIGSSYTEDDWSQQLLTLAEFIKGHVAKENDTVGYLAQHQLFEQIPELKNDFTIPDYCNFTDDGKEDSAIDINAWFGPKGTVSPLHYDPRDNLLCQVFGYKQVILYHPDDRKYLYTYDTRLLCNTAQADPVNPDYNKFPEFRKAQGFMCHLKPGEILYIPPEWWHHVVSLSPSFSISFWWN